MSSVCLTGGYPMWMAPSSSGCCFEVYDECGCLSPVSSRGSDCLPRMRTQESDDGKFHVSAEIPCFDKDEISVSLDRGSLIVSAEMKPEGSGKGTSSSSCGCDLDSFKAMVHLPGYADPDQIGASFKEGSLEIEVGRKKGMERKRIAVR